MCSDPCDNTLLIIELQPAKCVWWGITVYKTGYRLKESGVLSLIDMDVKQYMMCVCRAALLNYAQTKANQLQCLLLIITEQKFTDCRQQLNPEWDAPGKLCNCTLAFPGSRLRLAYSRSPGNNEPTVSHTETQPNALYLKHKCSQEKKRKMF